MYTVQGTARALQLPALLALGLNLHPLPHPTLGVSLLVALATGCGTLTELSALVRAHIRAH